MAVNVIENDTEILLLGSGSIDIDELSSKVTVQAIQKIDNIYIINKNIIIGDDNSEVELFAIKSSIYHKAELFQVYKNSSFRLGEIENYSTSNGSYFYADNLKFAYGFGNIDKDNSGSLYVYNSKIYAYCFWSFFSDYSEVKIIDSLIYGFGRIAGENSILLNVTFEKANGKYGILATKGEIYKFKNIAVLDKETYKENECSFYYNPDLSGNSKIENCVFNNVNELVYCDKSAEKKTLSILNSHFFNQDNLDVVDSLKRVRSDDNSRILILYSFSGSVYDNDVKVKNFTMRIYDKNDNLIYQEDFNYDFNIEVVYGYIDYDKDEIEVLSPHKVQVVIDDVVKFEKDFIIKNEMKNIPIYINCGTNESTSESSSDCVVDYDKIQSIFQEIVDNQIAPQLEKINTVEGGVKQILGEVSEAVKEIEYRDENDYVIII